MEMEVLWVCIINNSNMSFTGNLTIIFQKNIAANEGGAVRCGLHCNILFDDNSNITFSDSSAVKGGAVSRYQRSF